MDVYGVTIDGKDIWEQGFPDIITNHWINGSVLYLEIGDSIKTNYVVETGE
jgi:hypothetical protein